MNFVKVTGRAIKIPSGQVKIGFLDADDEVLRRAIANELGLGRVPSRPFMRRTIDKHKKEISTFAINAAMKVMSGRMSKPTMMEKIGKFVATIMRQEIDTAGSWAAPLATETLARKAGHDVLIDSGEMYHDIAFKVEL